MQPSNQNPLPSNTTNSLLAHGAGASLAEIGLEGLGLSNTLGEDLSVLILNKQLVSIQQ